MIFSGLLDLNWVRTMYFITQIQGDREKSLTKKMLWKINADDELREASIRQRVRYLENNLFDEYWDELLTEREEIDTRGNTDESSRDYVYKYSHH